MKPPPETKKRNRKKHIQTLLEIRQRFIIRVSQKEAKVKAPDLKKPKAEEKAKVVIAACGPELIQFLAALGILARI